MTFAENNQSLQTLHGALTLHSDLDAGDLDSLSPEGSGTGQILGSISRVRDKSHGGGGLPDALSHPSVPDHSRSGVVAPRQDGWMWRTRVVHGAGRVERGSCVYVVWNGGHPRPLWRRWVTKPNRISVRLPGLTMMNHLLPAKKNIYT